MTRNLLTLLTLVSISCQAQVKDFEWLIGEWKLDQKNTYEVWKRSPNGLSLEGISFRIKGADTVVTESLRLKNEGGVYYYIPDVAGDQGPVKFKIKILSPQSFVAENPQHDFPKAIRYTFARRDGADHLDASIEGDGKVIPYPFVRVGTRK